MSSRYRLVPVCRSVLFIAAAFLFTIRFQGAVLHAMLPLCSDVCGSDTYCSENCIDDSDTESTCGLYNGGDCIACPDLCGSAADCTASCLDGGSVSTCGSYNGGQSNGECYGTCGDHVCASDRESCSTCPTDCGYSCPPTCAISSCNVSSDCPTGAYICQDGCCLIQCSNSLGCGGHNRSCSDDSTCTSSADCCGNEVCVEIDYGGDGVCMGQVT